MVSMTDLAAIHGTEASAQRMKKRHAAEWRLKAYGIAAICVAGLALIALLWSVVGTAAKAMTEHYIKLDVPLDAAIIDPNGSGDPKEIGRFDFVGYTKGLLRETFPDVTSRRDKKQLYDVVSVGAAFDLRTAVLADRSLLDTTVPFEFLASDVVDLYLKGEFGKLEEQSPDGALTLTPGEKTISVSSTSNDFAAALKVVKDALLVEANRVSRQVALEENGIGFYERALENAETEEARADATRQIAARTTTRDALIARIEDMRARAAATDSSEVLSKANPSILLNVAGGWIKLTELSPNSGTGVVLAPLTEGAAPDTWKYFIAEQAEISRKVTDKQIVWAEALRENGAVVEKANWRFLQSGDSREPELAGLWGAIVGSFWTMMVTFTLAFPIGVLSAIYLEEFAPKNRITDFIEVNINNLAAVPSIIFGLLGLSIFLGVFGVPRSAPLAGGIVLALMTLPTIIIASRAAIRAVPPSIRDAALGLGASRLQTSFHHVLPLAMPGILTGTIIGMAQALGETAPLIMIGMVAFIVDIPTGITDSASALPVQIFRWADFPERAFEAKTAAAICILLIFLILMNAMAVFLRKQFERRW